MDQNKKTNQDDTTTSQPAKAADQVIDPDTHMENVKRAIKDSSSTRAVMGYCPDGRPITLEMRDGVLVGLVGGVEVDGGEK
jgi:hypothetical protein